MNRMITTSQPQKRSIATTLSLLDEVVCLFEEFAKGREIHSVCYEERNRLTTRQRKKLLTEIENVREQMRQLKSDLNLPTQIKDVGKQIWGHSAGTWEMLAELESKRLKGYGAVSAELAEYLDPKAAKLLDSLQTIAGIAGDRDEKV